MALQQDKRAEVRQLTGIRIVAALWVVFFHFQAQFVGLVPETQWLAFLADAGYMAVDLFFVLSGYIISYQYVSNFPAGRGDYAGFIIKRLARIYPVHLVTLLTLICIVTTARFAGVSIGDSSNFTVWGAAQDVFLVRAWAFPTQGWNFPAWSISAEFFAYLLFPVVVWVVARRTRRSWFIGLVIGMVIIEIACTQWFPSFNEMPLPLIRVMTAFTAGAAVYVLQSERDLSKISGWGGTIALLVLVTACWAVPTPAARAGVALLVAVATVGMLAKGQGIPIRILGSRLMEYGGRISFSVYMIHGIALIAFVRIFPVDSLIGLPIVLRLALVLLQLMLIIIAGAALYHFVERPAQRWITSSFYLFRVKRAAKILARSYTIKDEVNSNR